MSYSKAQIAPEEHDSRRWYKEDVATIPDEMKEILVNWSLVPEGKLKDHIAELRSRAFELYPYPCIGQLRFLHLNLPDHPLYPKLLSSLKNKTHTFLDAGCFLGQELRNLAFYGAPPETLYGTDLEAFFIQAGFDFFHDRQKMSSATFIPGDLLDDFRDWPEIKGKMDYIFANSLFHLFPRQQQVAIACRLVSFARHRRGSVIFGRQVGSLVAGEFQGLSQGSTTFRHNPESWKELWTEVGHLTGTRWEVVARMDGTDMADNVKAGVGWLDKNSRRIHFVVERLE